MRKDLLLAGIVAVAAALASVAMGGSDSRAIEGSHLHGASASKKVVRSPPHIVPRRLFTFDELSQTTDYALAGEVLKVEPAAPFGAEQAGAAPGAPPLQRQLVTIRTLKRYYGDPGETFALTQALLPGGTASDEVPAWEPGQRYVLFLRQPAQGGMALPDTLEIVGLDGRLLIEAGMKLKASLPNGPAKDVERREATLPDDIKRSKEKKGTP